MYLASVLVLLAANQEINIRLGVGNAPQPLTAQKAAQMASATVLAIEAEAENSIIITVDDKMPARPVSLGCMP